MNAKKKQLIIMSLLAGLLAVGMVFSYGCKESGEGHEGHEHAAVAEEAESKVVAPAEQTTCPVMGGAIDKNLFTEYKGKKVYFCCPECKAKFEAEPEKYIAKLPQFKQ
jgi:YHS domain-containing protein